MMKNEDLSSEIHLRCSIFDSLSYPTLILDPNMKILSANRSFKDKFGEDCNVVGKRCHEHFYNLDTPCSEEKCPLPKVFAEKKGRNILIGENRDGIEVWEERVFSPILDDAGEVAYVIESIRDVTHVKALERELAGTRNLMEKMIQSSANGIVAADMEGNVLLMNGAAQELFGYSFEQFKMEKNVAELYPPGVAKEVMQKIRSEDYGGRGKLQNSKVDIIGPTGETISGEISAAIIYEGGKEMATMGIYADITEKNAVKKKLEETQKRLAQAEKMASVGRLASGVAHEINNPLTGILFYADMALETLPKDDALRDDMRCIVEDVDRCKKIVKDLLTYSRQSSPTKNLVRLNSLVDQSLGLIHDQRVFGNVKIEKIMPDDTIAVNVDSTQLNQVIINLVMNAGDAMEGSGTLTLVSGRDESAGTACLTISDTGCGIPEEDLPNIFDPFFTTKLPQKGTGLGLSIVYGIIKENGGSIAVKETSPAGTTFIIELPLHRAP